MEDHCRSVPRQIFSDQGCSGVIKSDDTLLNVEKGEEERLNKLYVLEGSKPIEVPELHAGDIGAIAKLASVQTGDSLAAKANPVLYPKADHFYSLYL